MIRTPIHSPSTRRYIIIAGIIIVMSLCAGAFAYKHHRNTIKIAETAAKVRAQAVVKPTNTVDYSPAKSTDNVTNEQRKNDPSQAASTLNNGPTSNNSTALSITITRAGKDQSGQNLQVASLVEGASSGSCTITASKQGQTSITRQVSIEQVANAYTCPVVNIPLSNFSEKGAWTVNASVTSAGQTKATSWAANPVNL